MNAQAGMTVSVIMTCYNEGSYIEAAVRSVLEQTCAQRIEQIVIADDGSRPDTIAVLKSIETWDPRILVLYGPGGVGVPGQRNKAIAETSSDAFAILDGDDLWTADKLERQLAVLEACPDVGLVYADYFAFAGDLSTGRRGGVLDITAARELTVAYFLNDPPIMPSTTLIRRLVFDACGGFDSAVRVFEDTEFFLRIARYTRFALVNEPLLYKRNHASSITGGRPDLMAHHAYVALKAAADEPHLMKLVPKRLAERARKLGNQRFLLDDREGAVRLLSFAVRLDPLNRRAWTSLIAARLFPDLALRLLGSDARSRRAALGLDAK